MSESIFVEIDDEQNEIRRIVIERDVLELGFWGDVSKWITLEEYNEIQRKKEVERNDNG